MADQSRLVSLPRKYISTGFRLYGLMMFLAFIFPFNAFGDDKDPVFEEISVFFKVSGLDGTEVEALIKNEEVYLSITDLFGYLKIKNHQASPDQITGFFMTQDNSYIIDKSRNKIILGNKSFPLSSDEMTGTTKGLFLKANVFGKVFGLNCNFNFRSLVVTLDTKLELPVLREKRQALLRQNISKLKKEVTADTILKPSNRAYNFGALDWAITSTQSAIGMENTRVNFNLGTLLAGGETNISLNYDSGREFDLRRQSYRWRYAFSESKTLTQIIAGKIATQSVSTLFAPVVGLQFTNASTTMRRAFGSYNLTDQTEPGWQIELYINNILIAYTQADASGFFTFKVPMVYGSSTLKLKFIGPWGEERIKEQNLNIPYNFLPKNEMEYTVSAGILEDGKSSRFTRAEMKYGINPRLTAGSGIEYLSSLTSGNMMPFINASFRLAPNLFLTADYTHGVRSKAILNYRPLSDMLLEVNYTRYRHGQQAIYFNFLEERKASVSKPFRGRRFSGYSRLTFNQIVYPTIKQTVADLLFSGNFKNTSTNITTYAQITGSDYFNVYSNLSFALRLPKRYTFRPQIQYGYAAQRIKNVKVELEKALFRTGFLSFNYENNLDYRSSSFGMGLRVDLSFARASLSARQTGNRTVFTQSVQGGAVFDGRTGYTKMNNRSHVGKGGLILSPFLDINGNNRRDAGEPKVSGIKVQVSSGRIENDVKDSVLRIFDLKPFDDVLLDLSKSSFTNIAYQLKSSTYKVTIEPNRLKHIEVPVKVNGEVSGMVLKASADSLGQGRMLVNFFRSGKLVAQTMSENDGFFFYLGLPPGSYTAALDSAQLATLKLSAPASIPFKLAASMDGDIVSGLKFNLHTASEKKPVAMESVPAERNEKTISDDDTQSAASPLSKPVLNEAPADNFEKHRPASASGFSIRIRAWGNQSQAALSRQNVQEISKHSTGVFFEGTSYYNINISGITTRMEAEQLVATLARHGYKNMNIMSLTIVRNPQYTGPRQSKTYQVPATGNQTDHTRYAVVIGRTTDPDQLKPLQHIIKKVLGVPSSQIREGQYIRLLIIGFPNQAEAKKACDKLLEQGLTGTIRAYKVKVVPVKNISNN